MRIWNLIWGPLPPEVTTYFIWHDAGELLTGDLPFPVKSKNNSLKHIMNELEDQAVIGMGGPKEFEIDDYNRIRAKACDLIDMHEFGLHERRLGNQYSEPIITDTYEALRKLSLTSVDRFAVSAYLAKAEKLDVKR
jgi:5'-deoxynucleotidase YfbR-like HD superfamily hydrolase